MAKRNHQFIGPTPVSDRRTGMTPQKRLEEHIRRHPCRWLTACNHPAMEGLPLSSGAGRDALAPLHPPHRSAPGRCYEHRPRLTHSLDSTKEKAMAEHSNRKPIDPNALTGEVMSRFWAKTRVLDDGCIEWIAGRNHKGYGKFYIGNSAYYAHRVALVNSLGADSRDLVTDHLCRNRGCVNPKHLEFVDERTNTARGASVIAAAIRAIDEDGTCMRGHDVTLPNAWVTKAGGRSCRACRQEDWIQRRRRRYATDPDYRARENARWRERRRRKGVA